MSAITAVAMPTLSRLRDDDTRLAKAYESSLSTSTVVVGPLMALLAVCSPLLIPLVFGPQWAPSVPIAMVLGVAAIVDPMTAFDRAVLIARDRLDVETKFMLFVVVLHLCSVYLFAPHGLLPLAIAIGMRPFVTLPLRVGIIHRFGRVPWTTQVRAMLIAGLAGLTALVVAGGSHLLPLGSGWVDLFMIGSMYVGIYLIGVSITMRPLVASLWKAVRQP